MKVLKNIAIYMIPMLIWGVYLYLSPYPHTSYTINLFDLILLFLLLPIVYGIYNAFSKTKIEWLINTGCFIVIHAFGCWINDFVYIDDFFGKHYWGITYKPIDYFTTNLILIDFLILVICYFVKTIICRYKKKS